jgi:N-acetyl-anhydromuramyl-L-alanine amidase AmpD
MSISIVQMPVHASNFRAGRKLGAPRIIVIHTMQSSAKSAASWFAQDHGPSGQGPSSAHYGVTSAGEVMGFVSEGDTAFHAGNSEINALSIGVELEGDCDKPGTFTKPMLAALVELCHGICDRYGIPASRVTVIGHCDVPDARPGHQGEKGGAGHHHDPGPFPWNDFITALSGASNPPAVT